MSHHANGTTCPLCSEKIATLDRLLQPAANYFKQTFPEGHISWGFRDEENQNRAYAEGKTRAKWPGSKHNAMKDGKPAARAFDIFRIRPDGVPEWKTEFCRDVWAKLAAEFPGQLEWAGAWQGSFRETDHFQLPG